MDPWARRSQPTGPPALAQDERGQVLILTGVLLVLGFVVVGSTIIQMQALDETTARLERTAITQPTGEVIGNFERAIRHTIPAGHTNKTDFFERAGDSEDLLKDSAVRSGLYVAAALDESPDPAFLLAHCGGYDQQKSQGGLVMGHLKDDLKESIVGAVYLMHVTDGSRTMRWHHYVEIHECSDALIETFVEDVDVPLGSEVGSLEATKSDADTNLAWGLREQLTGTVFVNANPGIVVDAATTSQWVPLNGADADGGLAASHTGALANDRFVFKGKMPPGMLQTQVVDSLTLRIDASHTPQQVGSNDDLLKLTRKYPNVPDQTWTLAVTPVEQTFNIVPASPSGNGHWLYEELRDTTWEIWVDEVGAGKDVTRVFKIDWIDPAITYTTPQGHQMNATFTWTEVPELYHMHEFNFVYAITAATAGEQFLLEVYDDVNDQWDPITTLSGTAGAWVPVDFTLTDPDHYNGNTPLFRIRDDPAWHNDNGAADQDTVYIDFMSLESQADNQP